MHRGRERLVGDVRCEFLRKKIIISLYIAANFGTIFGKIV